MSLSISHFTSPKPEPCPDAFNIARYVLAHADTTPDKIALECLNAPGEIAESWAYAELANAVGATAEGLSRAGYKPGDKIILRLGNSADFPIAFLGAIALGAIPVPTSSQLTTLELDKVIDVLGEPAALILDDVLTPPTRPIPTLTKADLRTFRTLTPRKAANTHRDDPAYIIFTSGSSGTPKGVVHAHRAVWARRMMWHGWYDLKPSDRMLHAGAFNWTYTLGTGLMDPWAIGATSLVYVGPPNRHIWSELAHAHQATLFAGAPGVFRQLLDSPRDLATDFADLRHGLSAGEALPQTVRVRWQDQTNTEIFEALGMSEISTFISGSPPNNPSRPQQGREIALLADGNPVPIDTVGDLSVHKSDTGLMLGYYRRKAPPDLPLTGDWFVTGDQAAISSDGMITYHGRADALITAGGFRIAPEELEAALITHPTITDAAVAGIEVKPDTRIIVAFVVTHAPLDHQALDAHMKTKVAAYKNPRQYIQVESLPRRGNGKLSRKDLPTYWTET